MGNAGAQANGLEAAPVTLKDSVDGILNKVRSYNHLEDFCRHFALGTYKFS